MLPNRSVLFAWETCPGAAASVMSQAPEAGYTSVAGGRGGGACSPPEELLPGEQVGAHPATNRHSGHHSGRKASQGVLGSPANRYTWGGSESPGCIFMFY